MPSIKFIGFIAGMLVSMACQAEEKSVTGTVVPISFVRNETTNQCEVLVNRISSLQFDCEGAYLPRVVANYSGGLGDLIQVLIIQELPGGNACHGGPLHILAITREKKPLVADTIDFCGGKDPVITRKADTVFVALPGGPPNRGEGIIPAQRWSYKDGILTRTK